MYRIKGEAAINTVLADRNGRGVERKPVLRTAKNLGLLYYSCFMFVLIKDVIWLGFGLNEIASRAEYTVVPFPPF
jgi:hypothetical protein